MATSASARNGRDSNPQYLGVKAYDGQLLKAAPQGGLDHRAPARHQDPPRRERRVRPRLHALRPQGGQGEVHQGRQSRHHRACRGQVTAKRLNSHLLAPGKRRTSRFPCFLQESRAARWSAPTGSHGRARSPSAPGLRAARIIRIIRKFRVGRPGRARSPSAPELA